MSFYMEHSFSFRNSVGILLFISILMISVFPTSADYTTTAVIDNLEWSLRYNTYGSNKATLQRVLPEAEGVVVVPSSLKYAYNNYEVDGYFAEGCFRNLPKVTELELSKEFGAHWPQIVGTAGMVGIFENCPELQSVKIQSYNQSFRTIEGVLYSKKYDPFKNKDQWYMLFYPSGKNEEEFKPYNLFADSDLKMQMSGKNFAPNQNIRRIIVPKEYEIYGPFINCPNIESFVAQSGSDYYSTDDGILMSNDRKEIRLFPSAPSFESYTTPVDVNVLASNCVWGNRIQTINLTENITSVKSAFAYYAGTVTMDFIPEKKLLSNIGSVGPDCKFLIHGQYYYMMPNELEGQVDSYEDVFITEVASGYFGVSFRLGVKPDIRIADVVFDGKSLKIDEEGKYCIENVVPNCACKIKIIYDANGVEQEQVYEVSTSELTTSADYKSEKHYVGRLQFVLEMNSYLWNDDDNPDYLKIYCEETGQWYQSDSNGGFDIRGLAPYTKYNFNSVRGVWNDVETPVPFVNNDAFYYYTEKPKTEMSHSATDTSVKVNNLKYLSDGTWEPDKIMVELNSPYGSAESEWKGKSLEFEDLLPESHFTIVQKLYYGDKFYSIYSESGLYTQPIALDKDVLAGPTSVRMTVSKSASSKANVEKMFFESQDNNIYVAKGLKPETNYSVKLNIEIKEGKIYTRNIDFRTSELMLVTLNPIGVSATETRVSAETNISDIETSAGFQWKKVDAPESLAPSEGLAAIYDNCMAGVIKNLQTSSYYNVRAFYKDMDGVYYTSDWVTFDPSDFSFLEPEVHTYPADYVTSNAALVRGYVLKGSDEISEQGFEYWMTSNPSDKTVHRVGNKVNILISDGQMMTVELNNLESDTAYSYRSYAISGGETHYGEEQGFVTDIDSSGIVQIDVEKEPVYVVAYIGIDGKYYNTPQTGFNIILYSNGDTKKLIIP